MSFLSVFGDPKLLSAIIATITTVLINLIFKVSQEKKILKNKLALEYKSEQQKKIKNALAKYKVQILESGEFLNHRLINISRNYKTANHYVNGVYPSLENTFFISNVYRVLRLLSGIKLLEKELIFIDTTMADTGDLNFIKWIKVLRQVLQDSDLYNNIEIDYTNKGEKINRDDLESMSFVLIKDNDIISFSDFKEIAAADLNKYISLCEFFDGISFDENRFRWDRLKCFHLLLISFLNTFGYDFQKVSESEMEEVASTVNSFEVIQNLYKMLIPYKLLEENECKLVLGKVRRKFPEG
ncbi:MAG: hypothetical protein KDC34_03190 [Saprospiraceae bacterium]|nr:hypothetical protein [Saprospiraceae bacterium]